MIEIVRLHEVEGLGVRAIAKRLGVSRNTVRKYLREPAVPVYGPRRLGSSKLKPHLAWLTERTHQDGAWNSVRLHRELLERGVRAAARSSRTNSAPCGRQGRLAWTNDRAVPRFQERFEDVPEDPRGASFELLSGLIGGAPGTVHDWVDRARVDGARTSPAGLTPSIRSWPSNHHCHDRGPVC